MGNYNFCYNYNFLSDWFKANPEIKKYDVLKELGMTYYRTLQNWMEGITMMPLTQMMKFCNRYNVPISAFFLNEENEVNMSCACITTTSQIAPTCGWGDTERSFGIKTGDPRMTIHTESKLPSYCISPCEQTDSLLNVTAKDDDRIEAINRDERMRFLDIIAKQSKQIAELSKENTKLHQQLLNASTTGYGISMVAEDSPR